uniref:hypothetical protein n=1 Tax=Phocaeicola sartorii TaxID=671267 RepID=UPI00248B24AE
ARACGCAYRCIDGRRKGKEWERKRITAAVKNIRTFFKRTGIFLENGLILFRKDKDVRAGKERTYHYISGESRAHPEAPLKTPATEFCKTAATATTLSTETAMNRSFQGVVAPPFFMREKGLLPPLSPVFYPGTTGGGGRYRRRRRTKRREKETGTDRQNYGCIQTKPRLQSDKATVAIRRNGSFTTDGTEVTAGRNCSFNRMELKFQPDGTG